MDEDHYIFVTGLKTRMIIASGFHVYPRVVEMIPDMHPATQVSHVSEEKDMMHSERIKAQIVLKKRTLCRQKRNNTLLQNVL